MLLPSSSLSLCVCLFFFFNDTATTEIYTLSLHDALPISGLSQSGARFITRSRGFHRRTVPIAKSELPGQPDELRMSTAESSRGISPRGDHRTVRERLRSHGSCHPLKTAAFYRDHRVPPVSR